MKKTNLILVTCLTMAGWSSIIQAKPNQNQQGFAVTRELAYELLSADEEEGEGPTAPKYSGVVKEAFESAGYSYIRFRNSNDQDFWVATAVVSIKEGDRIALEGVHPMHGFHSKSLDRTFDVILFTNRVLKKSTVAKNR